MTLNLSSPLASTRTPSLSRRSATSRFFNHRAMLRRDFKNSARSAGAILSSQRKQKAFVLLKVEPGHERDVMNNLMELNEVRRVHIIASERDIIAAVEAEEGSVVSDDERVYDVGLARLAQTQHVQCT